MGLSDNGNRRCGIFKDVMQEGMSFDAAMGQVGATLLQTRDDMDATTVSLGEFNGTLREFAKSLEQKQCLRLHNRQKL